MASRSSAVAMPTSKRTRFVIVREPVEGAGGANCMGAMLKVSGYRVEAINSMLPLSTPMVDDSLPLPGSRYGRSLHDLVVIVILMDELLRVGDAVLGPFLL